MFAAVARFLGNVAGPAGTLLVLDDLHWAGPDALDLLASLVRACADGALRILGAYRDTDVSARDALPSTLLDLVRESLARRAQIEPLAPADAVRLLDALLAGTNAMEVGSRESLLRRTGGVPFYLVNCAQALHVGALDAHGVVSREAIPWDIAESIRQRVAAVAEPARELIAVAALAGRTVPRAALLGAVAAGGDDAVALEALDVAIRARLLVDEDDNSCHLAHDLVAEVVSADLSAARRAALHRRIAHALEAESSAASAELLAYHYTRAGEREQAAIHLERAGDRALGIYAYGEAERHFRELITQLDRLSRTADTARATEKLAATLMATARYDEAMTALAEARSAHRVVGDTEGMARVAAEIGQAHTLRGTPEEGIAWLPAETLALETRGLSPNGLANLYIALANLLNASNRNDEALAAAERGAELARLAGANGPLARAERRRGNAFLLLGRVEEAITALDTAIPLAEAEGDLKCLWGALNSLGAAHAAMGDYARTAHAYLRAFAATERIGDPAGIAFMWFSRGELAYSIGEWDDAHTCFESAAATIAQVAASRFAAYPPLGRGMLALARGRREAGLRCLSDALVLAERHGDRQALRWIHGALAEHEILDGRASAAYARLAPMIGDSAAIERDLTLLLPNLAWAQLEMGQMEPAAKTASQAVSQTRAMKMRPMLAAALRIWALAAIRGQRWSEAEAALDEALAIARPMPAPYIEAKVLFTLGQLHTNMGATDQGRERFRRALTLLRPLGERHYGERIEQLLAIDSRD
jgi:tetratricopeptide (TPR) repeat protein